jgi:hypothetical protein
MPRVSIRRSPAAEGIRPWNGEGRVPSAAPRSDKEVRDCAMEETSLRQYELVQVRRV